MVPVSLDLRVWVLSAGRHVHQGIMMMAQRAAETLISLRKTAMDAAPASHSPAGTAGNETLAYAIRNVATDTKELVRYAGCTVLMVIMMMAQRAAETLIFSAKKTMAGVWGLYPKPARPGNNMMPASAIQHARTIIRV
jgi:hypothetical protein